MQSNSGQGPVSRKFRKLCGPEKSCVKLQPGLSVKLVFLHVAKGIKIKVTAKFRASRRLRFKDKRKLSPEMRPKSPRDFGETGRRSQGLPIMQAQSGAYI